MTSNGAIPAQRFHKRLTRDLRRNRIIYAMGFLCLAYYIIFCYLPMGGIVIAFKNFRAARGIFGSAWADPWYKYFDQFFGSYYFWRLLRNTLLINFYDLLFGFPAPILLALLLNELRSNRYKRVVQTVTYMPHFISQVVVCGIILDFFSSNGLVNQIIQLLGGQMTIFMQDPKYFRGIYVGSNIWQEVGYSSIIYLSALSAVDMELYDAAAIDGCNRFKRVLHVTLPGIMPTIVIMLILRMGSIMSNGFEQIYTLQNTQNLAVSEVFETYTYRVGLLGGRFSFATTVGL